MEASTKAWFWFWNEKYPHTQASIGRFKPALLCTGSDTDQSSWKPCKGSSLLFQLAQLHLQKAVAHSAHTDGHGSSFAWMWHFGVYGVIRKLEIAQLLVLFRGRKTQIANMRNTIKKTLIHVVFFIIRTFFLQTRIIPTLLVFSLHGLPDKNFYLITPVPAFNY